MKVLALLGIALSWSAIVYADEPVLFDQFGVVTCEDLQARTVALGTALQNDPSVNAVVLIYRGREKSSRADWYRKTMYLILRRNEFDSDRVMFIPGSSDSDTRTTIYLVPRSVQIKESDANERWPDELIPVYDLSKPFLFHSESEPGICETFVPGDYADIIKKNPTVSGKIVVHPEGKWSSAAMGRTWIETFVNKYGIPRARLRLIYGKPRPFSGSTEFWITPAKGHRSS